MYAKGGDAALHAEQAVKPAVLREARQEPLAERTLVGDDRVEADGLDILDRRDEARQQLMRERAGLEARTRGPLGCRANLVRPPALEQLGPREGNPEMRPEELVVRVGERRLQPAREYAVRLTTA